MKHCMTLLLAGVALVGLSACEVEQVEEGQMPEVEVEEEGQLPEYDVDMPDVDVGTTDVEMTVPTDVDVETRPVEVEVPTIDVDMPEEEPAEQMMETMPTTPAMPTTPTMEEPLQTEEPMEPATEPAEPTY